MVRLLRACFDPTSRCLLTKYVRKQLTASHAADGKTVLITFELSLEDTAPLTASPDFWNSFFREVEVTGRCEACMNHSVEAFSDTLESFAPYKGMGAADWEVGDEGPEACHGSPASPSMGSGTGLLGLMWRECGAVGPKDLSVLMMQSAMRFYFWVVPDNLGRPRLQVSVRLEYGGCDTGWHVFMHHSPSGEEVSVGEKGDGCFIVSSVLLPEDGEPLRATTFNLFMRKNSEGHSCDGTFGVAMANGMIDLLGHFSVGQGRFLTRQSSFFPMGGAAMPEVDDAMRRLLQADFSLCRVPWDI